MSVSSPQQSSTHSTEKQKMCSSPSAAKRRPSVKLALLTCTPDDADRDSSVSRVAFQHCKHARALN